ncbi:MAG: hypothetical protein FJY97_05470 [candidate division Zixibacteria bacterium]|nr:hypothetical protein [candidate division Zixibacteria bacterium]
MYRISGWIVGHGWRPAITFWLLTAIGGTALAAVNTEKVLGPMACMDCHKAEYQAFMNMKHQKAFDGTVDFEPLQRKPAAQAILEKLELRSVKREPCTTCHYTSQPDGARTKVTAGVSCESCHGGAKDWLGIHNNYGMDAQGNKTTRDTELPDHRATRLAQSTQAGMIRPDQLFQVAENCFQCHTVPNEELVNKGGHTAGSPFELVSWAQGEVRHNFMLSNGAENREAPKADNPVEHRRLMYVIGRMLDLEHSLRAAAKATQEGPYIEAMKQRVTASSEKLKEIQTLVTALAPTIGEMLTASDAAKVQPNNQTELDAVADRVKTTAQKIATGSYGNNQLAALDTVIPGPGSYKGTSSNGK